MKKQVSILFCLWIISGLSACNMPIQPDSGASVQQGSVQYQTASVLLTATAQISQTFVATPSTVVTIPSSTVKATPSAPNTPGSSKTPGAVLTIPQDATRRISYNGTKSASPANAAQTTPCDLAQPGHPIDVSVPDDSRFVPGEYFTKTWRLVNAGACPWTEDYSVVWFSGDDMGINRTQPLNVQLEPGKSVDVTVEMVAPQVPGTYQSNWKLRNAQGEMFGIGSNGDAPFWVRITVIEIETPTPTPVTPTVTRTPIILNHGALVLSLADGADMDDGLVNQNERNDLLFQSSSETELYLAPVNSARIATFGLSEPGLNDCLQTALTDVPLALDQVLPGTYLCYQTNNGLTGRVLLTGLDLTNQRLSLDFATWAVP